MRKLAIEQIVNLWSLGYKGDYYQLSIVVATSGSIDLNDKNITLICSGGRSFILKFGERTIGLDEYLFFLDDSDIFKWLISITEESAIFGLFSSEGESRLMDYFGA